MSIEVYSTAQMNAIAAEIGEGIKAEKTQVIQAQGQSTTAAVSQKLFTDTVGDIADALTAINGEPT